MRIVYKSIGGDNSSAIYALTERDLTEILANHFDLEVDTVDITGIQMEGEELVISGRRPSPDKSVSGPGLG